MSGSQNVTGAFMGTGASLTISTIGFKPRHLKLFNADDPAFGEYFEGMPDDYVAKQKGSATTYATSGGITLTATGFTIGTDTDLNVSGEQVFFHASR